MNRTIEQTLLSLLPTQNSALPPSLVDLAGSLLTQSRHRASTLKAEEEIARTYACAHIACDRLKITLDLPPIDPRPPIPPRIYKRLYGHLDKVLPNTSSPATPGTPHRSAYKAKAKAAAQSSGVKELGTTPRRNRFRDSLGVGSSDSAANTPAAAASVVATALLGGSSPRARVPSRPTPGKEQSLSQFRESLSSGRRYRAPLRYPKWVRPVARFVCAELGAPRLVASVIAGMDAITTADPAAEADASWVAANMTALLGAIVFCVVRSADKAVAEANDMDDDEEEEAGRDEDDENGGEEAMTREEYKARTKRLLDAMARARDEVVRAAIKAREFADAKSMLKEPEVYWEGWEVLKAPGLKAALLKVMDRAWLESDWYRGVKDIVVPVASGDGYDDNEEGSVEEQKGGVRGGGGGGGGGGKRRRTDSMFHEGYDYLSKRRMREFRKWREVMLANIEGLECRPEAGVDVDVDADDAEVDA